MVSKTELRSKILLPPVPCTTPESSSQMSYPLTTVQRAEIFDGLIEKSVIHKLQDTLREAETVSSNPNDAPVPWCQVVEKRIAELLHEQDTTFDSISKSKGSDLDDQYAGLERELEPNVLTIPTRQDRYAAIERQILHEALAKQPHSLQQYSKGRLDLTFPRQNIEAGKAVLRTALQEIVALDNSVAS